MQFAKYSFGYQVDPFDLAVSNKVQYFSKMVFVDFSETVQYKKGHCLQEVVI